MPRPITFEHFICDERESGMARLIAGFNDAQQHVEVQSRVITEGICDDTTEGLGLLPPYLGNSLPDVVMVYGLFVATLADQGRIRPLDDFVNGAEGIDTSDFVPGVLDTVRYGDRTWALPIEGNPYALYCNLPLLEHAGMNVLPRTWGDVFQTSALVTSDTDGDGRVDRYGYTQCSFQVPLLMWQAGGDLVSGDRTRVTFDSEECAQALKFHADLRMYSPPHVDFERGDVAMKLNTVEDYFSGRYEHLDFEVVPLPRGRRAANSFGGSDSTLCLAIRCAEPECERAAWRFLRWFTTQQGLMDWARATAYIPLMRPVLESADYREFVARWPKLEPFIDQLGICHARPCIPEYPVIKWAINASVHESRRDNRSCTVQEAREILRRHAAEAQEVLERRVRA